MLTDFLNASIHRHSSEFVNFCQRSKRSATHSTRCPSTLWNAPELRGPNFYAKLSHSKGLLKYLPHNVSTILLTNEKMFTVVTPKNAKNHQLYATAASKKKVVTTKRLWTRSTFRQSLMASVGKSQVVEKTQVWYLSITESKASQRDAVSYCSSYVRSRASSSSFSRTVRGARFHWRDTTMQWEGCQSMDRSRHGAWDSPLSYQQLRQISTDFKNSFKVDSSVNL